LEIKLDLFWGELLAGHTLKNTTGHEFKR